MKCPLAVLLMLTLFAPCALGQSPLRLAPHIAFTLSRPSHATVRVYDANGRIIRTLFDDVAPAGETTVTWNAAGLKGGIYFYQVEAGGFRSAKKVILVD